VRIEKITGNWLTFSYHFLHDPSPFFHQRSAPTLHLKWWNAHSLIPLGFATHLTGPSNEMLPHHLLTACAPTARCRQPLREVYQDPFFLLMVELEEVVNVELLIAGALDAALGQRRIKKWKNSSCSFEPDTRAAFC
jgi:hypothetical protein